MSDVLPSSVPHFDWRAPGRMLRNALAAAWALLVTEWKRAKQIYSFLMPLRFSFLALAVLAFAFLMSDQGRDVIATMVENDPLDIVTASHPMQRVWLVILANLLAAEIWFWSRQLLHIRFPHVPSATSFRAITVWTPRILGVLVYAIMIVALFRVGRYYGSDIVQPLTTLWRLAIALAMCGVVFIPLCMVRRRVLLTRHEADVTEQRRIRDLPPSTRYLALAHLVLATAFLALSTFRVEVVGHLGATAIILIAMSLWVAFGSFIVALAMKVRFPIITALVVYVIAISPLADNHVIRSIDDRDSASRVSNRPTVASAFASWSAHLRSYPMAAGGKHPVFIVATEGGGIRAAYWTAAVLTALDDDIPGFRDHLFAVSGVSGGSVGTATYASLVVRQLGDPAVKKLRPIAANMLAHDSLAPTIAATAEQDFLQRFVPFPLLPDRQRALEGAWERAWADANGPVVNDMAMGMLAMMNGREDRMPSIFLNGTTVETGSRVIASNCRITGAEFADSADLFDLIDKDVPLSAAAGASARFTYVSPAGTIRRNANASPASNLDCAKGAPCEHVVDGGYFDNSGATTAIEIANAIRSQSAALGLPVEPYVIVIRYGAAARLSSEKWMNEALSPVRGLMNVRNGHASLAVAQLKRITNLQPIEMVLIPSRRAPMPLGWLLSLHTRGAIDAQIGPGAKNNAAAFARVAALLKTPAVPDVTQRKAASAPTVMKMLAR